MIYRGYELEQKKLMVGYQITITKDNRFVRHGSVVKDLSVALDEAHKLIDDLLLVPVSLPTAS
jgi:hypothetical protein